MAAGYGAAARRRKTIRLWIILVISKCVVFFFQAEDGIRDLTVTGVQTCAHPISNTIFNLQIRDPAAQPKKSPASSPFDYVEWGSSVYPGWLAVDQAAIAITETAPLFLTPGRRCQNGRPVPVYRADWKQYVAAFVEVGDLAHQTLRARKLQA